MEILGLSLFNFRNFSSKKLIFDKNLTVIIGPNGSGKSNILEAMSLLSGIRPLHVQSDIDLVKFGKSEAAIQGKVSDGQDTKMLIINFQIVDQDYVKKSYLIGAFKKRLADFANIISIIVFHPQDLELVSGSPSLRRHHLDSLLSAIDRVYWRNLASYNKIIVRRNKVLARILEGKSKKAELDFWDERLVEHGKYISGKREDFFEFLNFIERSMPLVGQQKLGWELKQSTISQEKLLKNRERDITAGITLSGPHRDDFKFLRAGRDLSFFGSRGETRMAVLALKLAELEYVRVKNLTMPILALDDIFSELDWEHREAVIEAVGKQQTIITAAEVDSVPKELLKKARIVKLG